MHCARTSCFIFPVEGVSDFIVGVTDSFDGSSLSTGDLTQCMSFSGYPRHGDVNNVFACSSVVTGRYVAVYSNYAAPGNPYKICEVEVHAKRREYC